MRDLKRLTFSKSDANTNIRAASVVPPRSHAAHAQQSKALASEAHRMLHANTTAKEEEKERDVRRAKLNAAPPSHGQH